MFCLPEPTDNANVNFVKYKGDYYVSTETKYMRRVNPQSLETKEKVSQWEMCLLTASSSFSIARSMTRMVCMLSFFNKVDWSQYIAVNSASAHPHYDRDGSTYNMGNSYSRSGNLSLLFPSQ